MGKPGDGWLLLHGTPLTPQVWGEVAARLSVVAPVRCPGLTLPAETAGPDAVGAQRALAGRLAARLTAGPGPVHVAGHSFGGQVALDLARLAPDRVALLTIICSRDSPFPAFSAAAQRLRTGLSAGTDAALSRWFTRAELAKPGPVVEYARRCLREADPGSWAAALDAIACYDRTAQTPAIDVPATLIAAELDQVSTPAAMAALADRLPRAALHVLPGAAHMSPFTDPGHLSRLIAAAAGP